MDWLRKVHTAIKNPVDSPASEELGFSSAKEYIETISYEARDRVEDYEQILLDVKSSEEVRSSMKTSINVPVFSADQRRLAFLMEPMSKGRKSILLYHSLGSGKTNTALHIAETIGTAKKYILSSHRHNFFENIFKKGSFDKKTGIVKNAPLGSRYVSAVTSSLKSFSGHNAMHLDELEDLVAKRFKANQYVNLGYVEFANQVIKMDDKRISLAYENAVIIIDEVHHLHSENEVDEDDEDEEKVVKWNALMALRKIVKIVPTVKLVAMSATPMFDRVDELDMLIDLFYMNERIDIEGKITFSGNELTKASKERVREFSRAFVSYINQSPGGNFPKQLGPDLELEYAIGGDIPEVVKTLDLVLSPIAPGGVQYDVYESLYSKKHQSKDKNRALERNRKLTAATNFVFSKPHVHGELTKLSQIMKPVNKKTGLNYNVTPESPFASADNLFDHSTKLWTMMEMVKEQEGRILIYTRFVQDGVYPIAAALEMLGYTRFGGDTSLHVLNNIKKLDGDHVDKLGYKMQYCILSKDKKLVPIKVLEKDKKMVSNVDFIKECKVFIITRTATEGVDFKGVRHIHIFEPWYNLSRIRQVVGRGVRYNSHNSLPESERQVNIYLHAGVLVDDNMRYIDSIDVKNYEISMEKMNKILAVTTELRANAIDCGFSPNEADSSYFRWDPKPLPCHFSKRKDVNPVYNLAKYPCLLPMIMEDVKIAANIIKRVVEDNVFVYKNDLKHILKTHTPSSDIIIETALLYIINKPIQLNLTNTSSGVSGNIDIKVVELVPGKPEELIVFKPYNSFVPSISLQQRIEGNLKEVSILNGAETVTDSLGEDVVATEQLSTVEKEEVVNDDDKDIVIRENFWLEVMARYQYIKNLGIVSLGLNHGEESVLWYMAIERSFPAWKELFQTINQLHDDIPEEAFEALRRHPCIGLDKDNYITHYFQINDPEKKNSTAFTITKWLYSRNGNVKSESPTLDKWIETLGKIYYEDALRSSIDFKTAKGKETKAIRVKFFGKVIGGKSVTKMIKPEVDGGFIYLNDTPNVGVSSDYTHPSMTIRRQFGYILDAISLYYKLIGVNINVSTDGVVDPVTNTKCGVFFEYPITKCNGDIVDSPTRSSTLPKINPALIPQHSLVTTFVDTVYYAKTNAKVFNGFNSRDVKKYLQPPALVDALDIATAAKVSAFYFLLYVNMLIEYASGLNDRGQPCTRMYMSTYQHKTVHILSYVRPDKFPLKLAV